MPGAFHVNAVKRCISGTLCIRLRSLSVDSNCAATTECDDGMRRYTAFMPFYGKSPMHDGPSIGAQSDAAIGRL